MNLSERVRKKREELGWSQEELAFKMGYTSRTSINKIENGRPCSQKIIAKLADALMVSIPYLMGWTEEIENQPVEMATLHAEMIMDEDMIEIYGYFKKMNAKKRSLAKDLIRNLAETDF